MSGAILAGLIVVETTWLVTSGRAGGPLWFDVLAAGSLMVGILAGAEAAVRWRASRAGPRPGAPLGVAS